MTLIKPSEPGRTRRLGLPLAPIYPVLFTIAFVINDYAASNVSLEALPRPLIVAVAVTVLVQLALSAVLLSPDRGAYAMLVLQFALIGLAIVAVILLAWLVGSLYLIRRRGRALRAMPWLRGTFVLNAFAAVLVAQVVVSAAVSGAFVVGGRSWSVPRGTAVAGAPDIYLIMLDGYPRADTLASIFDYDNGPFLSTMGSMDVHAATASHSNYDFTVLTLASLFNGAQIPSLVPVIPDGLATQFRLTTRLINEGSNLERLRAAGYELVSIPSGYYEAALLNADRVLDSGQLSSFEMQLLRTGSAATVFKDVERSWLPGEHRARILSTFAELPRLASERGRGPKFVFAHILSPHMPLAFAKDGGVVEPLPCFPLDCSLYDYGDPYGDAIVPPMRDQIDWLNRTVERVVAEVQAASATPPVIVIFSDHGMRNHPDDHAEMFRSLLLASTPGRVGVFPNDATPVNLLTRLVNAYTGTSIPLSSEESWWLDTRQIGPSGFLHLTPFP